MSLIAIADTKGCDVAGHRAQNSCCRTSLVRAVLLCPALVRIFLLLLRQIGNWMQDTGLLTLFDSGLVNGGQSAQCRTE